jgi:Zn-dependent alcohol dehydrogenase
MKSLAGILNRTSHELIVDEFELPDYLKSGQVLVRVITSGICGAQINEIDAVKGPDKFLPHLLGHEGFCEVINISSDVQTVKVGDFAIMHWRPGLGIQSSPPKYFWNRNPLNAGWVTTFNQHAIISENRLTKIESTSISRTTLPLLGCALTTAFGVLKNEAKVDLSDNVLIFGAGGVGLTLLKILNSWGIGKTVIVDIDQSKVKLAKSLGAFESLKFETKRKCFEDLQQVYGNNLPTVAIETTGKVPCIELAYEISHPQARVILIGVPKKGEKAAVYTLPLHFGKTFIGSQGGGSSPHADIPFLLEELESGRLDFSDFPVQTYKLENINQAILSLRSGTPGRMIIDMEKA